MQIMIKSRHAFACRLSALWVWEVGAGDAAVFDAASRQAGCAAPAAQRGSQLEQFLDDELDEE
jgi:hypothetical protein